MEFQSLVALTLLTLLLTGTTTKAATFTFKNKCPFTIWPSTLTGGGLPQLSSTGFVLPQHESFTLTISPPWSGRFWARTGCASNGKFICQTGDCSSGDVSCNGSGPTPPVSLAEFTLQNNGGLDFYDISLVDGFNLPISVIPEGGSSSDSRGCNTTSCSSDLNSVCPADFAVRDSEGSVVACKSACLALKKPEFCCTGDFGTPDKCPPSNYSKIFKQHCPQAYSYAYDDKTSTFTCSGAVKYTVEFCP